VSAARPLPWNADDLDVIVGRVEVRHQQRRVKLISGWPVKARHRLRPLAASQPARLLRVGPRVQEPTKVPAGAFQTRRLPPIEVSSMIARPLPG
jgi:hypothetical protein